MVVRAEELGAAGVIRTVDLQHRQERGGALHADDFLDRGEVVESGGRVGLHRRQQLAPELQLLREEGGRRGRVELGEDDLRVAVQHPLHLAAVAALVGQQLDVDGGVAAEHFEGRVDRTDECLRPRV